MKRRYQLLLIIVIGIILTIIINSFHVISKTNITALGDGLSAGMTPYNVVGTSFNDYLKEKLNKENNLSSYNYEFSYVHQTIHELNEHIDENNYGKTTKIPIKQIIAKSDIVTIAIGIDELASISLVDKVTDEMIYTYLNEMNGLLSKIRDFYEKDIIVLGLYPANNLTKKDAIEINSNLKKICGEYNAYFLDIIALSLNEKYYLEKESYYMNYLAHKEIAKIIYNIYKK